VGLLIPNDMNHPVITFACSCKNNRKSTGQVLYVHFWYFYSSQLSWCTEMFRGWTFRVWIPAGVEML